MLFLNLDVGDLVALYPHSGVLGGGCFEGSAAKIVSHFRAIICSAGKAH